MTKTTRGRILLAEDEEHLAKLILFKLDREGFETVWAENGAAAWDKLSSDTGGWNLLILDIMMPVMTGLEVLKKVKADPILQKIPVLILTAKGFRADVAAASDLGAEQYMHKPFDPGELVKAVNRMATASDGH